MKGVGLAEFDYEVLDKLTDWKRASDLAYELHTTIDKVQASLEKLLDMGLVCHDGPLFINRYGVVPDGW